MFPRNFSRAVQGGVRSFAAKTPRPTCHSNRSSRVVKFDEEFKPADNFWTEVADEKAVSEGPKYVNNIERYVGTVKLPVGMIGPLKVHLDQGGDVSKPVNMLTKDVYVPMATTEGALVASYNRGAKAITLSGGATATVLQRQMIRAPCFTFDRVADAARFIRWFRTSGIEQELTKRIESEPHCHAVDLHVAQTDCVVHLHIGIDSEDAAGQNMVTYCGRIAMEMMKEKYNDKFTAGLKGVYIEGGFNSGKRGSALHLVRGKGMYTVVDCILPATVCKSVLHATPEELVHFQRMHQRSSCFISTLSFTAHVANGLTAFFIANGQDPACTAESQAGVTHFELREDPNNKGSPALYASMTLPSLIVSTIGGGTNLPSQKACRDIIGVEHPRELAGVLAASCLSGELSFYAAMAAGEFDRAHFNMTHK